MSKLRTVAHCRPERFATMVPATPDDKHVRRADRQAVHVGRADRRHGDDLGRGALRVGKMRLADALADRHDDALPADHGAETQGDRDRDLHPGRDELGRVIELPFVLRERLLVGGRYRDRRQTWRAAAGPRSPDTSRCGC